MTSDPHVQSPGRCTGGPAIRPRHSPWRLAATVLGVLLRVSPHARLWRRALARRYPRTAAWLDGLGGRWRRR